MRDDASSPPISSVDNALRLLLLLSARGQLRIVDAAESLGVARSTAHRLMTALLQRGFATQDARKIYRPGPALVQLKSPGISSPDVRAATRAHLEALRRKVGETCHLAVLEGNGVRFVDCVESPEVQRVGSRLGMLLAAHTTAIGKALLAELSAAEFLALYPRGLPTTRGSEIACRARLQRELTTIRRRGYAVNLREADPGIKAVGACLRSADGTAVAGIAVTCPAHRCPDGRIPELADAVLRAVEAASANLAEWAYK
ncbi:MAG TPA: IclR family transcriptional regulator [Amycolatopsis sp.]|uniref:IclR family transcriptional regulator n=1 Tax=Amycolatopsis sp. TaxID=37632 RepID=UPI002B467E5D|nr:IclR family transcriptional regulator [Amycolatopsis sp.]HJQ48786.1 IclR family transcriptional regulator [Amycolatopsis sp.]HKS50212.1 IclR family transcriptional regulator [Amycolatopsis sp.]